MNVGLVAALSAHKIINPVQGLTNGLFKYSVPNDSAFASFVVYNIDTEKLVRTIESGKDVTGLSGALNIKQWDGLLDDETPAPAGNYEIRILTHNVQYPWLGTIGNRSNNNSLLIGNGVYSMAVSHGKCYLAGGYAERDISTKRFGLNSIADCADVSPGSQTISAFSVCSNDNMVIYAGEDSYSQAIPKFLYAFDPITEQQIIFDYGRSYNIVIDNRFYASTLGYSVDPWSHILDTAATNDFLFVSREPGVIETYDLRNNSGALLFTMRADGINRIGVENNNLWTIESGITKKYTILSNGDLAETGLTINQQNAFGLKYNAFANEVAVSDIVADTWNFYDATTGAYKATLGSVGGYSSSPVVTNYKFCLKDIKSRLGGVPNSDIAFQPDGQFFISDIGNYRINRYNADHTYRDQLAYVPSSRSCAVDPNDPTRVFSDKLEFRVDYNLIGADINTSWTLVKNWSANTSLDEFEQFKGVFTLPNGYTYGYGGSGVKHLYHLDPVNGATYLKDVEGVLEADGSLHNRVNYGNERFVVTKQNLVSGGALMLEWGSVITMATTPQIDANFPFYYIHNTRGSITNPNRQFFYNPVYNYDFGNRGYGNHLVSIKNNTNFIEWQASRSTGVGYLGEYPKNGDFATNSPGQAGSRDCLLNIHGSNLFTHVNDELGIYTQAARTNHFHESGIFIGHFGTDNKTVGLTGDTRYWAGNSFSTNLVKVGNDLYYFYCDESKKAGVHVVKATNLDSIAIQRIPITVTVPGSITPIQDPSNLMANLPRRTDNFTGNNVWILEVIGSNLTLKTGERTYLKEDRDISIGTNTANYIKARINTVARSNWKLSGFVSFENSQATFPGDNGVYNYLDLTDTAGKVIARFAEQSHGYTDRFLTINDVTIPGSFKAIGNLFGEMQILQPFVFYFVNNALTFKIANYNSVVISNPLEVGALFKNPAFLAVNQSGIYGNRYHQINLKNIVFQY